MARGPVPHPLPSNLPINQQRLVIPLRPHQFPHEKEKEGPSTSLTFLGILLDSSTMQASITAQRKTELLQALGELQGRRTRTCTKRELLSIIGKLAFACKVVPPGRIFLHRLINLSTTVDLAWWLRFLSSWSGTSLFLQFHWSPTPDMELYTDASDTGYWSGQWFNTRWTSSQAVLSITWRELYAILVVCATWGHLWVHKRILFHCDNAAVVAIWQRGSCKCPHLMSLVRHLFFLAAMGIYHVGIAHIPGVDNCIADHLSRFSMQTLRHAAPDAALEPTPISIPVQQTDL